MQARHFLGTHLCQKLWSRLIFSIGRYVTNRKPKGFLSVPWCLATFLQFLWPTEHTSQPMKLAHRRNIFWSDKKLPAHRNFSRQTLCSRDIFLTRRETCSPARHHGAMEISRPNRDSVIVPIMLQTFSDQPCNLDLAQMDPPLVTCREGANSLCKRKMLVSIAR